MGSCVGKECYKSSCCGRTTFAVSRFHNRSTVTTKPLTDEMFDTFKSVTTHETDSDLGSDCMSIASDSLPSNTEEDLGFTSMSGSSLEPVDDERPYRSSRMDSVKSSTRRPPSSMSDESIGDTVQWKKGNRLGKGTYGTVYCGLTITGELIAVKQIELDFSDMKSAEKEYESILQEVELLKSLKYPYIVGYLGTCLEENIVNIFMEFVPGGSLASILAKFGPLEEPVIQRYLSQLLEGINYMHSKKVVHRDIKSANIMLMPNGIVKLIDFGCARKLKVKTPDLKMSLKGTPYWMAPEIIRGAKYGLKSDIWSLGCTVYELATGRPPWGDIDPLAAMYAIGADSKPLPSLSEDKYSPQIKHFLELCLKRQQRLRPPASVLLIHPFIKMAPRRSKRLHHTRQHTTKTPVTTSITELTLRETE